MAISDVGKIDRSAISGSDIILNFSASKSISSFTFYLIIEFDVGQRHDTSDVLTFTYAHFLTSVYSYESGIYDSLRLKFDGMAVQAVMSSDTWTKPEAANCPFSSLIELMACTL